MCKPWGSVVLFPSRVLPETCDDVYFHRRCTRPSIRNNNGETGAESKPLRDDNETGNVYMRRWREMSPESGARELYKLGTI